MKTSTALLIVAGLTAGCQPFAQSAENPDSQVMNFLGVVIDEGYPEAEQASTEYISINGRKGETVYNQRMTESFQPCEAGRWLCIWNMQLKIMIPKEWTKEMQSWDFRGVKFRIVGKHYEHNEISEIFVEAKEEGAKKGPQYYLYSFKRGLVSFRVYYGGRGGAKIPVVMSRLW